MHRKHSWKICELPETWFRTVYFNLHTVLVIIIHSVAYNESIPVLSAIPHVHPRTVQHAICRAALETFPLHQERTLLLWLHITRGRALEEAHSGGGSAWDAPHNLSNLVCSDHAGGGNEKQKGAVSVKKRDGAQLHVTDGRIIHCKHFPCEVRIFLVEIFSWTDCGFLSHYMHLLMQACVNSGTLVQFACQFSVTFPLRLNAWSIWKSNVINKL